MENFTSRRKMLFPSSVYGAIPLPQSESYTSVYCHLETLSSSLSPSLHLTQLAAITGQGELFKPIVPPDLTKYLDNFKLGGDLLMLLNMTREEDRDSFLFGHQLKVVSEQTERRKCVSEEEALRDLFTFLETAGENILLVCVDEYTVSVLLGKLKALDKRRMNRLLSGFTWWRRTLPYIKGHKYNKDLELESYHQATFPKSPQPSLYTALVVASMIKTSVEHSRSTSDRFIGRGPGVEYKAYVRKRKVEVAREVEESEVVEEREELEIYNSFRKETTMYMAAEKIEQVTIDSDSEDENVNRTQMFTPPTPNSSHTTPGRVVKRKSLKG